MTTVENDRGRTDRRRDGAESATRVFDRLFASSTPPPSAPVGEGSLDGVRAAAAAAIDTYSDLLHRAFELYADLAEGAAKPTPGPVVLSCAPGGRAETTVWARNSTDAPAAGVTLRLTDLTAHDGRIVAAATGSFEPRRLTVDPGAAASAWLTVAVPADAPSGIYYGYVLADGLPLMHTPVRLEISG